LEEVDLRLHRVCLRPVEEGRNETPQHLRSGFTVGGEHCGAEVSDHPLIDLAEEVLQGGERFVEIALVQPGRLTDGSDGSRPIAVGSEQFDPGGDDPLAPGVLPRLAAGPGVGASSTYHTVILTTLGSDCKLVRLRTRKYGNGLHHFSSRRTGPFARQRKPVTPTSSSSAAASPASASPSTPRAGDCPSPSSNAVTSPPAPAVGVPNSPTAGCATSPGPTWRLRGNPPSNAAD